MRVFKSDHRYKHYRAGYHYIAEFARAGRTDHPLFVAMVTELRALHGHNIVTFADKDGWPNKRLNEHYIIEQRQGHSHKRIYVKNESDLSLILLKLNQ